MGITVSVTTKGAEKLERNLAGADRLVGTFALQVEANAKAAIQTGGKSGRTYRRGRKGTHTASAPGEAPATDTGQIAGSIHAQREKAPSWRVAVTDPKGLLLEKGTRRILPRPFLLPALEKVRKPFIAAVRALFND
jgi:hypothetical protein